MTENMECTDDWPSTQRSNPNPGPWPYHLALSLHFEYFHKGVERSYRRRNGCHVALWRVKAQSQSHLALPIHFACSRLAVGCPKCCWTEGVGWSAGATWPFKWTVSTGTLQIERKIFHKAFISKMAAYSSMNKDTLPWDGTVQIVWVGLSCGCKVLREWYKEIPRNHWIDT